MRYVLQFTRHAIKDFAALNFALQKTISKKLDFYLAADDPMKYAEPLKAPFQGKYRFRVGEYRIMFVIEPSGFITILWILNIKHRKDAYR